jgi:hypothetical protein
MKFNFSSQTSGAKRFYFLREKMFLTLVIIEWIKQVFLIKLKYCKHDIIFNETHRNTDHIEGVFNFFPKKIKNLCPYVNYCVS